MALMPASASSPEDIEVAGGYAWRRLGGAEAPAVDESAVLRLRGLSAGSTVEIGDVSATADERGTVQIRMLEDESLRGHLGLIDLRVDGRVVGEIDVVPGKVSRPAYDMLRADLERVWAGLVFAPGAVSSVQASLPPPEELWRRIEAPVRALLENPRDAIVGGVALRRVDRVRRASEMTPALVRRGARGQPGPARVATRSVDTPEQAMVARALRLLLAYARRSGATDLEHRLGRMLRDPVLRNCTARPGRVTWGMRSDARYRQVLEVQRVLDRPELAATEGPGELRLGVGGMVRLYEYWVFLQVLLMARSLYGDPLDCGFADLAVRTRRGPRRLELPAGTTLRFPGDVYVAFEPRITSWGDGWMGLEYVPHPDPDRPQQLIATPDVAVLRGGANPWLTIIDAKYVARSWVERSASRIHEKYARIRRAGSPVVRHVIAAHPHTGLSSLWAGYGHASMVPGEAPAALPLPRPEGGRRALADSGDPAVSVPGGDGTRSTAPSAAVAVLADQWWMHRHLGARRIDLAALRTCAAGGAALRSAHIVLPDIAPLAAFAAIAGSRGWDVQFTSTTDRTENLDRLVALATDLARGGPIVVVSGDDDLRAALGVLDPAQVTWLDDLESLPTLNTTRDKTIGLPGPGL